jgi:hypothetical protein
MSLAANLSRFTFSAAFVAVSWATLSATALAQVGASVNKEEASKSADPRKDIEVEAMIPGIAHPAEAKQAVRRDLTLLADPGSVSPIDQLKAEINATNAELKKTKQLIGELLASQKERANGAEPPPLKDAEIRIFTLQRMKAVQAAEMVQSLLDHQSVRIAVDERTNGLIVIGKKEPLLMVEALLQQLDQQAKSADGSQPPDAMGAAGATRRTLMLRVYWLADGIEDLSAATDYLPKGVVSSLAKLGMDDPRLVTQTVNSLSAEEGGASVDFSTNVPAILFGQPMMLTSKGGLSSTPQGQAEVDMDLSVGGPGVNCQLKGSLQTPLGHYMVLGTASSIVPQFGAAANQGEVPSGMEMGRPMGGEMGMGMPMGRAAMGGEGFGMGMGMGGGATSYGTSRFAFVVQVIEAESFQAEDESPAKSPARER